MFPLLPNTHPNRKSRNWFFSTLNRRLAFSFFILLSFSYRPGLLSPSPAPKGAWFLSFLLIIFFRESEVFLITPGYSMCIIIIKGGQSLPIPLMADRVSCIKIFRSWKIQISPTKVSDKDKWRGFNRPPV